MAVTGGLAGDGDRFIETRVGLGVDEFAGAEHDRRSGAGRRVARRGDGRAVGRIGNCYRKACITNRLSVREGAKVAKVDAADIQRIRNADLSRFTLDRLVRIAYRLGRKVELHVLPVDAGAAA